MATSKIHTKIFQEQYQSLKRLPNKEKQAEVALAMLDFAFNGEYDSLDDWQESIMDAIKPSLYLNQQSDRWGGQRNNSGRKKNQDEIKMINQDKINLKKLEKSSCNQDDSVIVSDIVIDNNINIPEYLLRTDSYEELSSDERYYYDHQDLRPLLVQFWNGKTEIRDQIGETYLRLVSERMAKIKQIKKESSKETPEIEKQFEEWWNWYPRDRRGSKSKSFEKFKNILKTTKFEVLLEAVKRYSICEDVKKGYACGAEVWLNNERWNNIPRVDEDLKFPWESLDEYKKRQSLRTGQAEPIIVRGEQ